MPRSSSAPPVAVAGDVADHVPSTPPVRARPHPMTRQNRPRRPLPSVSLSPVALISSISCACPLRSLLLSRGATPSTAAGDKGVQPPTAHWPHPPREAGSTARARAAASRVLLRRGRRRAEDKIGVRRARRPAMAPHPTSSYPVRRQSRRRCYPHHTKGKKNHAMQCICCRWMVHESDGACMCPVDVASVAGVARRQEDLS